MVRFDKRDRLMYDDGIELIAPITKAMETMMAKRRNERKTISLVRFFRLFPDDQTAERWFERCIWPNGVVCPFCSSDSTVRERKHRKPQPYRCVACRRDFSVKVGTLMHGSKLPYQTWALAIYILLTDLKGQSSLKIGHDVEVTQKTAWYLAHRIRQALVDEETTIPFADQPFSGSVEADEAYIGGKEKNKHADKRLNAGRGPVGKAVVVGMKDRQTGNVKVAHVEDATAPTLQGFVRQNTTKEATVYTDEARAYTGMPRSHQVVRHSVSQYVDGMAHTNGIESFWAMLKRGYVGTYHSMSVKHLSRYIGEFSGRHNLRPRDTIEQMAYVAHGLAGKRLRFIDLIGPRATRQPSMITGW